MSFAITECVISHTFTESSLFLKHNHLKENNFLSGMDIVMIRGSAFLRETIFLI